MRRPSQRVPARPEEAGGQAQVAEVGGGGLSTQVLGATEVEVEEEWVWREDSKKGSHYCWLRKRLIAVDCRTDSMALNILFNPS